MKTNWFTQTFKLTVSRISYGLSDACINGGL